MKPELPTLLFMFVMPQSGTLSKKMESQKNGQCYFGYYIWKLGLRNLVIEGVSKNEKMFLGSLAEKFKWNFLWRKTYYTQRGHHTSQLVVTWTALFLMALCKANSTQRMFSWSKGFLKYQYSQVSTGSNNYAVLVFLGFHKKLPETVWLK